MAQHANYVPWRRALCPAGGNGVVRDQRHRLHLRSVRHQASRQKSRRGRRRHPHPTRHREPAGSAWLTETRHKAKSWDRERRTVARIEATMLGLDIRFVVTSLDVGSAEWIYDSLYCARGQAENLIKLHKTQLASDRTSCRSALANQVRLVLHTAAYWLMLTVRDAIPKVRELAAAEFATLRLRLLKIAARVVETTSRIRLAFAAACPEADLICGLPGALLPLGP
ncbi:transposase (plasmid) [Bradyrhizobium barranii subsp. barranii]|uniref:Transposase n=1 Tax=Bradyrhizobium barranii subsp. barranii TaxID=2823807 RepID=A0A9X9YG11_9BRAD|nr:transposase [Bradyrhizobium barranii]UGX89866.1 transposase [Bradyrhizobium barranii subsp. barranii]